MNLLTVFFLLGLSQLDSVLCEKSKEDFLEFEKATAEAVKGKGRIVAWYNATLTCHRPNFCAIITYFEDDLRHDDKLTFVDLHCTKTSTLQHSAMVILEDGDGILDDQYEPAIRVRHDCGLRPSQYTTVDFHLPAVAAVNRARTFHMDYERNLTGLGLTEKKRGAFWWTWPLDSYTQQWIDWKRMDQYPELYNPKVAYWYRKGENSDGYHLCVKSSDRDGEKQQCEYYSTAPSFFQKDDFWQGMMVASYGKQKRSVDSAKL